MCAHNAFNKAHGISINRKVGSKRSSFLFSRQRKCAHNAFKQESCCYLATFLQKCRLDADRPAVYKEIAKIDVDRTNEVLITLSVLINLNFFYTDKFVFLRRIQIYKKLILLIFVG